MEELSTGREFGMKPARDDGDVAEKKEGGSCIGSGATAGVSSPPASVFLGDNMCLSTESTYVAAAYFFAPSLCALDRHLCFSQPPPVAQKGENKKT